MNKIIFVRMLPEEIQKEIRSKLVLFFLSTNDSLSQIKQNVRLGMDSRLCDLADTIDITPFLK